LLTLAALLTATGLATALRAILARVLADVLPAPVAGFGPPREGRAFATLPRRPAVLLDFLSRDFFERDFAIGLVCFYEDTKGGGCLLTQMQAANATADAITPVAANRFSKSMSRKSMPSGLTRRVASGFPNETSAHAAADRSVPVEEVMHAVQPHDADENEVDRDDIIQQPRYDQNQDAGEERDQGRDVGSGDDHDPNLLVDLSDY
jgi:hypothetical protein